VREEISNCRTFGGYCYTGSQAFYRWLILVCTAALLVSAACRPHKRYDLLEAELRQRERELAETRSALEQARHLNEAYARQLPCPHPAGAVTGSTAPPSSIPLRQVTLARGTGGIDEDGAPGDEALMVVVAPKDEDDAVVKVPGRVEVWLWEVAPSGQKEFLGSWAISPERLRPTWRQGWISSGYFLSLPWPRYPRYERLRIAVRFTALDGRVFETDRDIRIKPVPTPVLPPQPGSPLPPPPVSGQQPLFPEPLPPGTPPPVEELPPPGSMSFDRVPSPQGGVGTFPLFSVSPHCFLHSPSSCHSL
jgi:heme exporter protein D